MIFITDGNGTHENPLSSLQSAAETSGTENFAIGVGEDVSWDTLHAIAYDPDPLDQDPDRLDFTPTSTTYTTPMTMPGYWPSSTRWLPP